MTECHVDRTADISSRQADWRVGRHIVELGVLADGLSSCKSCGLPLQLSQATSLISYGVSAIIKVPCSNTACNMVNNVPTGKRTKRVWDANSKMALGLVHAGIGVRQLNSLLSELNIPPVTDSTMRKRQNDAGSGFEFVANESVEEAIEEELRLNPDDLTASVDGAWQKRGSGRSYDSLSGHCSMIGNNTGKVIGYSVRSKYCKLCDIANSSKKYKEHDCRKNWAGSSKAMEPDMVIEMVTKQKDAGHPLTSIVADDDTTTASRLSAVDHSIKKKSDKNYVRKNITSALYNLQARHKSLSKKVIRYLEKCTNYLLAQNQGNPEKIRRGFDAMSRHPFNDHSHCDISWCSHINDNTNNFKSLPFGRALSDKELQKSLENLFSVYQRQTEKFASLGSTQANESFNKMVSAKAPKAHFYSGTSSLHQRVGASVAQKNYGHEYITKV